MASEWDVFVSYSSSDRAPVSVVVNDLEGLGLKVWWDKSNIIASQRLRQRINDGIANSSSVMIFISPRSLQSEWVLNELDAAMMREIQARTPLVIPILLGRVDPKDLPPDLQGKKYIDLRHNFPREYSKQRGTLFLAIKSLADVARRGPGSRWSISIGDELVAFFLNYKFTWRTENPSIPEEKFEGAAEALLDHLEDIDQLSEWPEDVKAARESFINRYGRRALQKLILFALDTENVTMAGVLSEESDDLIHLMQLVGTMLLMFETQTAIRDAFDLDLLEVSFTEDGRLNIDSTVPIRVQE